MNLDEPSAWPDIFGSWRDAYTIRRFWTYVGAEQLLVSFIDFFHQTEMASNCPICEFQTVLRFVSGHVITDSVLVRRF